MFSWFPTQQLCAEWWLALNTGYFWRHSGLLGGELNHPSPFGGPDNVFSGDSAEQALLSQKPSVFATSISLTFPVLGSRPRKAQLRLWASSLIQLPRPLPRMHSGKPYPRKPRCAWPPLPWPLVPPPGEPSSKADSHGAAMLTTSHSPGQSSIPWVLRNALRWEMERMGVGRKEANPPHQPIREARLGHVTISWCAEVETWTSSLFRCFRYANTNPTKGVWWYT